MIAGSIEELVRCHVRPRLSKLSSASLPQRIAALRGFLQQSTEEDCGSPSGVERAFLFHKLVTLAYFEFVSQHRDAGKAQFAKRVGDLSRDVLHSVERCEQLQAKLETIYAKMAPSPPLQRSPPSVGGTPAPSDPSRATPSPSKGRRRLNIIRATSVAAAAAESPAAPPSPAAPSSADDPKGKAPAAEEAEEHLPQPTAAPQRAKLAPSQRQSLPEGVYCVVELVRDDLDGVLVAKLECPRAEFERLCARKHVSCSPGGSVIDFLQANTQKIAPSGLWGTREALCEALQLPAFASCVPRGFAFDDFFPAGLYLGDASPTMQLLVLWPGAMDYGTDQPRSQQLVTLLRSVIEFCPRLVLCMTEAVASDFNPRGTQSFEDAVPEDFETVPERRTRTKDSFSLIPDGLPVESQGELAAGYGRSVAREEIGPHGPRMFMATHRQGGFFCRSNRHASEHLGAVTSGYLRDLWDVFSRGSFTFADGIGPIDAETLQQLMGRCQPGRSILEASQLQANSYSTLQKGWEECIARRVASLETTVGGWLQPLVDLAAAPIFNERNPEEEDVHMLAMEDCDISKAIEDNRCCICLRLLTGELVAFPCTSGVHTIHKSCFEGLRRDTEKGTVECPKCRCSCAQTSRNQEMEGKIAELVADIRKREEKLVDLARWKAVVDAVRRTEDRVQIVVMRQLSRLPATATAGLVDKVKGFLGAETPKKIDRESFEKVLKQSRQSLVDSLRTDVYHENSFSFDMRSGDAEWQAFLRKTRESKQMAAIDAVNQWRDIAAAIWEVRIEAVEPRCGSFFIRYSRRMRTEAACVVKPSHLMTDNGALCYANVPPVVFPGHDRDEVLLVGRILGSSQYSRTKPEPLCLPMSLDPRVPIQSPSIRIVALLQRLTKRVARLLFFGAAPLLLRVLWESSRSLIAGFALLQAPLRSPRFWVLRKLQIFFWSHRGTRLAPKPLCCGCKTGA